MLAPKQLPPDPVIKRISVKDHINGVITARDDARTGLRGLKSTENTWLKQDGTVGPRPSTVKLGPQPAGKVLGEIFEFKKVSGSTRENWLICMQSFSVSRSPSASQSPSASVSPSSSASSSASSSLSPSASASLSPSSSSSPSASLSPSSSASSSASASRSPSASLSPSSSASRSVSPSASLSPSSSTSMSPSSSLSPSSSSSPSSSVSASPSAPITGYAQIFVARIEDTSWTAVSGKYFDSAAKAHFFQIAGKVVIMNAVDTLAYYNISTNVVVPFTAISNPSAPTLTTNTGLSANTDFSIYYRISANSTVGESAASNALTVQVSKDRDFWDSTTQSIKISWSAVSNATSYNVYMGTVSGFEYLIASGINSLTFTDDGSAVQDNTRLYPTTNSTAGMIATRGANIGGRAFILGDTTNPYYVWNGGDPGFELDFTPVNGGGFSLVNNGGKELPSAIKLHRDGKGTPVIKVYCSGTRGKRFSMTSDQVTFGDTVISFYDVQEDEGETGTNAPDAILYYNNSMYYPSSEGIETDGTLPQIQNVLTSRKASNTIQPDIASLNQAAMGGACGFVFDGRLCFALPVNASSNNQIWVLDLERKGAWMKPWNLAADWMWVITDNSGNVHHMVLVNNVMYDMSYSALTSDNGSAFLTSGQSGQIYFSDDKRMWVQLLQVIFVVLRSQGQQITFNMVGKTEDEPVIGLGEPVIFEPSASSTPVGWGEVTNNYVGWGQNRWSTTTIVSTTTNDATQEVPYEVDETVQWAAYSWNSSKAGVDYNISDIIYEYQEVGILDLQ